MRRNISILVLVILAMTSCEQIYLPKPKGYNRIELPTHKYIGLQESHPYKFEHSVFAQVTPHKSSLTEPHWIDVIYPTMGASVQFTYKKLNKDSDLETAKGKLLQEITKDARKLTSQHNVKAYSIEESVMKNKNGVNSFLFELEGEVPSQFQFFSTDSSKHFLRGALYFPHATKNDSLAPVIEYIKTDIIHLLNSLEWDSSQE